MGTKNLIVLVGPTAVGKTETSLKIAKHYNCDIISADSRQMYKHLKIGTAAPNNEQLKLVKHHMVGLLELTEYYNASKYEHDVLALLNDIFKKNNVALLTGGSMLYIDAVIKGIDLMPDVDPDIRERLYLKFENGELDSLRLQLKKLDPEYYKEADLKNHVRIIHALEVCLTTGKPFSWFRKKTQKNRPFNIILVGVNREREELFNRINQRVHQMIDEGLEEEVKSLLPYKQYNSLQTVGYKEMFDYLEGQYDLDRAIELIQRNSRRYAKKQITWFKKYADLQWFNPESPDKIIKFINEKLAQS